MGADGGGCGGKRRLRTMGYRARKAARPEYAPTSWWAPRDLVNALDAYCEKMDVSKSAVLRRAVTSYLRSEGGLVPPE